MSSVISQSDVDDRIEELLSRVSDACDSGVGERTGDVGSICVEIDTENFEAQDCE